MADHDVSHIPQGVSTQYGRVLYHFSLCGAQAPTREQLESGEQKCESCKASLDRVWGDND